MEVEVTFYGTLVQPAGGRKQTVRVPGDPPTVADLRAAIARALPAVAPQLHHAAVGMGPELFPDEAILRPDEEISILPPVSGG
ncbi:MAG: MoaD/ThiS family protein [Gemmatimonadota bacterium]